METVGGAAVGVGMLVAAGEIVGAAEGDWPPAVAATMQMNARRNPVVRSMGFSFERAAENRNR